MATATLTPYYSDAAQTTYALVSSSTNGAIWKVAGRSLAEPYQVELTRKIGPSSSLSNDHVILRISKSARNATTGKPATGSATLDISIPRDNSILTAAQMRYVLGELSSLMNESVALNAGVTARTALIEGRDL